MKALTLHNCITCGTNFKMNSGSIYGTSKYFLFFAGGDTQSESGFQGCIRRLYVQGEPVYLNGDVINTGDVINGTCAVQDR